jgi:hypothetical protein
MFQNRKLPSQFDISSISIKDFVREKKSATEKRKSNRNFFLMKLNLNLNLNAGWLMGEGGGLVNPCKAWVPPPSKKYNLITLGKYGKSEFRK